MQTFTPSETPERQPSPAARWFGYLVAIAVNFVLLGVVNALLAWGWPPFLTEEFRLVLPYVNVSLVATIGANVVWLGYDRPRFRSLCNVVLAVIAFTVARVTWQVFPFDFTGYRPPWETIVRIILVLAMVGIGIGAVADLVKLATGRKSGGS
jgi:hypothetical protein